MAPWSKPRVRPQKSIIPPNCSSATATPRLLRHGSLVGRVCSSTLIYCTSKPCCTGSAWNKIRVRTRRSDGHQPAAQLRRCQPSSTDIAVARHDALGLSHTSLADSSGVELVVASGPIVVPISSSTYPSLHLGLPGSRSPAYIITHHSHSKYIRP